MFGEKYILTPDPGFCAGGDAAGVKRRKEELPVFEQGENAENPLRCPVKLYEFYLSKWYVQLSYEEFPGKHNIISIFIML